MSERGTRRSTRISRQVTEPVAVQEDQEDTDALNVIQPHVKRQKIEDTGREYPEWYKWLSDETLVQLARHPLDTVDAIELRFDTLSNVRTSWEYQYVITWIYNVSESFVTKQIYPGGKSMWKTVNFDEILFMKDFLTLLETGTDDFNIEEEQDDEEEVDESKMNLYELVRLSLLRQLGNNKSIELREWDTLIKESFDGVNYNSKFISLPLDKQFEIFLKIIKQIESKNMVFKNFIANNMELFNFIKLKENDNENILFMTYPVSIVKQTFTHIDSKDSSLHVPIMLKNCTVSYEDSNGQIDLEHLDYSKEIDSYLKNIIITNEVLSYNFSTFLKTFQDFKLIFKGNNNKKQSSDIKKIVDSFESSFEWVVLARINSAKLLLQRVKNQSMRQLMTRRKRSTRLIEKEEETKKKVAENHLEDKIDHRQTFLKLRKRTVAKIIKRCKENMWNQLWAKFEQDCKIEKKSSKWNMNEVDENVTIESPLNLIDKYVLPNGLNYNTKIIITDLITEKNSLSQHEQIEELPTSLCITEPDIVEANQLGMGPEIEQIDNQNDWMFQCTCMTDKKTTEPPGTMEVTATIPIVKNEPIIIHQNDGEEINLEKFHKLDILNRPIICCDVCHKWQHWECQEQSLVDLLSFVSVHSKKDLDNMKFLTQRDFGTVTYDKNEPHHSATRRTSRRQHQEEETEHNELNAMRPVDRRTQFGECAVFVCPMCLGEIEQELRGTFEPELTIVRAKQKKQHDDRERRKAKKLLEKQQALSNASITTAAAASAATTPVQNHKPVMATFSTGLQNASIVETITNNDKPVIISQQPVTQTYNSGNPPTQPQL
ncbi:similar to Saccharomyces cerevisiae YLR095C IOC2 Member of a complex (Isw1b) with Isw1p and Ioc4p [Maudiozyma barnettii]|uniref:Similar to Saccharomyces cerevisiae YLR095C IOC2 Member of a complex (Isw1b) with Isw1p and Ioc4p n=1 Tax=Maudiozyma barnettii TaxID=61262 RepID=A0A8H2VHM9_9SACH|nr:Ioc2p [Kazachstania barnettii]CAB4255478.1 similar to Saccharomyces cerevisiae YLR095C IOC2 Member of a complex (Isw1b) with Isw1p and Ioc4p [Kazachstania barnettii]CAD1783959.1 similar to Saccharomyces cerevisiae YLR095C IOC2 Member of a complex (Isw1b) with Isw1p and Ioc4p [Kazachstania barnettii]